MFHFRIVLADDHVLIRHGIRRLLQEMEDLEVVAEAGDGLELLALLKTLTPDLVIVDISMPHLSGIEALRTLKKTYPEVKVLILTMHKEYVHQVRSAGGDGYLLKEDVDREIIAAIEKIQAGEFYLSPKLRGKEVNRKDVVFDSLSNREKEVLKLIVQGTTNREIAENLYISVRTVESHRASLLKKMKQKNTAALVKYALEKGYV
jgi:DNA-binding NarL/FixJ family response regulator